MSVTIIIPAYNEERTIKQTIDSINKVMRDFEYELIVVNDCATDRTAQILKKCQAIVINHPVNRGYGASLKTGITASKYENIIIIDADGTYPVDAIPELLKYEKYDLVSGMRTKNAKIPLLRRPAKWMLTKLAMFLVDRHIPDLNCGLRLMKKSNVTPYFKILPNRFSFTTTHLLSCVGDGARIKFVSIRYFRRKGTSTIHPIKDFIGFSILIFRSGMLINPIKFFMTISINFVVLAVLLFFIGLFWLETIPDITIVVLLVSAVQIFLFGLLADLIVKKLK